MDYEAFKTEFMTVLRESGLSTLGSAPEETLDLRTTSRTVSAHVLPVHPERERVLHVAGTVSWTWDALQTARTRTTEEDVLHELLGLRETGDLPTDQPALRVDLKLTAGFEWGKEIPMPPQSTWARWGREAIGRMGSVERLVTEEMVEELENGGLGILAWQGEPTLKVTCDEDGGLRLASISLSAFQMIELPRIWDDPDREPDPNPASQLSAMFARVKAALHAWGEVMDHLVRTPESPRS